MKSIMLLSQSIVFLFKAICSIWSVFLWSNTEARGMWVTPRSSRSPGNSCRSTYTVHVHKLKESLYVYLLRSQISTSDIQQ